MCVFVCMQARMRAAHWRHSQVTHMREHARVQGSLSYGGSIQSFDGLMLDGRLSSHLSGDALPLPARPRLPSLRAPAGTPGALWPLEHFTDDKLFAQRGWGGVATGGGRRKGAHGGTCSCCSTAWGCRVLEGIKRACMARGLGAGAACAHGRGSEQSCAAARRCTKMGVGHPTGHCAIAPRWGWGTQLGTVPLQQNGVGAPYRALCHCSEMGLGHLTGHCAIAAK